MDRLGEVLSQTETPVETDELSMQDKSEVTELFIELCDVLGIVPEESSIKQLAEVLLQRQELVKELIAQKPHLYEKGTHEVINHLSKLLGLIKNVLEPIHLAIGRFVVASQRQLQPALI